MRNVAACLGLINVATQGKAPAAHCAYVIWYIRGRKDDGSRFLMTDGVGVGYGARPSCDGIDAVYLIAQENYPAEFLDAIYPVRLRRYAINPDTGGPGRWRGGCGIIREIEVLAPEAVVSVRIDAVANPPWGVAGGRSASGGRAVINPGTPQERVVPSISDGHKVRRATSCASRPAAAAAGAIPSSASPSACSRMCAAASSAATRPSATTAWSSPPTASRRRRRHDRATQGPPAHQAVPSQELRGRARLMSAVISTTPRSGAARARVVLLRGLAHA
jgi:hypothetical protein